MVVYIYIPSTGRLRRGDQWFHPSLGYEGHSQTLSRHKASTAIRMAKPRTPVTTDLFFTAAEMQKSAAHWKSFFPKHSLTL